MRLFGIVSLGWVFGCAALQVGQAPPAKVEVEIEDEESGIDGLKQLLRDCRKALGAKSFDEATRLILRAERAVKKASDVTRSHPDFEDVSEEVAQTRQRVDQAIEEDRIARREAAIDDLIRRATAALKQGLALQGELQARVPAPEDIAALEESVNTLAGLRNEGQPFADQPRYQTHAADRDGKADALAERLNQARWQVQAGAKVAAQIEEAYQSASSVREADSPQQRVVAFQKAANAFQGCVATIAELATANEYRDEWLIETRLGVQSLGATKKICTERAGAARREALRFEWHTRALALIEALVEPLRDLQGASTAGERLEHLEAALAALANCAAEADKIGRHPGHEGDRTFDTAFGKLTVGKLRAACEQEKTRLERERPALDWRQSVEEIGARLNETKSTIDEAERATDPAARVKSWQTILGGLKECQERARGAGRARQAERGFAVTTAFGRLTTSAMEQECERLQTLATKRLQESTAELELARFLATCRADEVAVAKREGIPTRIQNVNGGRIFVYQPADKKRGEAKHFSFDTEGKRVDFRLRWLNQVSNVVNEINRVVKAIADAPNGSDALKATEAALPVFDACVETLRESDKNPGYDGSAVFTTLLGKVPAAKLSGLCASEKLKRAGTLVGLRWRIRFEALRDRVADAQTERERAKAAASNDERAKRLGTAVGGFTECSERAESILKEEGADKKLKVNTPFGSQTLAALAKSCQQAVKAANDELAKALADKALDDFVASCKGDEAEVARRHGIPSRIEERIGGRIFVFETTRGKKKQQSRFAFDAAGKRTDEKALKPKPKSAP